MPTNSGIIAAMQRIHYHTGRQAGRPASKLREEGEGKGSQGRRKEERESQTGGWGAVGVGVGVRRKLYLR